jgi:hypothetical protein
MTSGFAGSTATDSTFFSSAWSSALMRRQVLPRSAERNTPPMVPATSTSGFDAAWASARTDWPAMPGSMTNVLPPSSLRATPPPFPPTSQ